MKRTITASLIIAMFALGCGEVAMGAQAVPADAKKQEYEKTRTTGAELAALVEDARLECSGHISLNQLHAAIAKALKENTFDDSDAPEWRAGMAAALRQHASYISMTEAKQAEFCANLIAKGFIK